jgi:hypothetical protein
MNVMTTIMRTESTARRQIVLFVLCAWVCYPWSVQAVPPAPPPVYKPPITFNPQIQITTDNPTYPPGGSVPFYMWWSSTGNAGWPTFVYSDTFDSIDNEPSDYPQEYSIICSVPAAQLNGPPARPWIPPSWGATIHYALGLRVQPSVPNGHMYICTRTGISGGMPPAWPLGVGATVDDPDVHGAQWTEQTFVPPTGLIPAPPSTPTPWTANQQFYVGDKVRPTAPNSHTYVCTRAGNSGMNQPAFPKEVGATVDDPDMHGVQWTEHTPVIVAGVSSQWSADLSNPVSLASPGSQADGSGNEIGVDYALQKRFVPGQQGIFDLWIELKNDNDKPAEVRIVYALFQKPEADSGQLIPIKETDRANKQHIFRRLRHGGSTRYIVSKTPKDYPYIIRDLRVDLSTFGPGTYVYLDVFVVNLTNMQGNREFGSGGAMKRLQILP